MSQKTISIVTACYNEEENVLNLYNQVREVMAGIGRYEYEHIFIDNSSRDNTVAILKAIAAQDKNVKIIVNARNFGHIRSPIHALFQARGDAVISIVADLQDPPQMIADMVREWENGAYCVLGIKRASEEASLMFWLRKQYYRLVERISSIETIQNFTGFGLYDRKVIELVRSFEDPYPYFRGMIAEIGLPTVKLMYDQPARKFGITNNNWYSLYDMAMLGIISNSKIPLRLAVLAGFLGASVSFLIAVIYLVLKLVFWSTFSFGLAPMLIGVFFISSLQLVFLGVMGEYIGAIYTQVQNRPYVVELDRINFEVPPSLPKSDAPARPSGDKLQLAGPFHRRDEMAAPLSMADLDLVLAQTRELWEEMRGQRVFITGGTGFFGCWLVESFCHANRALGLGARATVLTRDPARFRAKCPHLAGDPAITLLAGDVRDFEFPAGEFRFVIHAATEASEKQATEEPLVMLSTILAGTERTLQFAAQCDARKFLLTSSGAVYGRQPPELTHVPESYDGAPEPGQCICGGEARGGVDVRGLSESDQPAEGGAHRRDGVRGEDCALLGVLRAASSAGRALCHWQLYRGRTGGAAHLDCGRWDATAVIPVCGGTCGVALDGPVSRAGAGGRSTWVRR